MKQRSLRSLKNISLFHSAAELKRCGRRPDIADCVYHVIVACEAFGLTISVRKTDAIGPNVIPPPLVNIDSVTADVFDQFTYRGPTSIVWYNYTVINCLLTVFVHNYYAQPI